MGSDDSIVNRASGPIRRRIMPTPVREALLTAVVVFAFTTVLLLIAEAPPLEVYYHLFQGALGSWSKFTQVVKVWIP